MAKSKPLPAFPSFSKIRIQENKMIKKTESHKLTCRIQV